MPAQSTPPWVLFTLFPLLIITLGSAVRALDLEAHPQRVDPVHDQLMSLAAGTLASGAWTRAAHKARGMCLTIAQLAEHLTVVDCRHQSVLGSIPSGEIS